MLKDKNLLHKSNLFEDLNQKESEIIKGGIVIKSGCRTPKSWGNIDEECHKNYLYTAPLGSYINNLPGLTKLTTEGNADKKTCNAEYSGYTVIIPGTNIRLPRTVNLEAYAKHDAWFGGRGAVNCELEFETVTI